MKRLMLTVLMAGISATASAQFGGVLNKGIDLAKKAQDAQQKYADLNVTEEEEQQIGADVSAKLRERYGVVQDAAVHKYVTLVGTLLAQQSERPKLPWTFVVLDTDGVNAFAAPGGIVHITRGALGLARNEAELAGVLAHEIGHVAHKHTVNAIRKNKAVQLGTGETLSGRAPFLDQLADKAYEMVLKNSFDRGDELDSDAVSVRLTQKIGYAPASLAAFLTRLDERNKDQPARNGLFASHPETKERIDKIRAAAGSSAGAAGEARYTMNVHYTAPAITAVAAVADGAAGLAGSTSSKDTKKTGASGPPPKKGFGLGSLKQVVTPEKQSGQVTASGGSRGVGPDRDAVGGGNPALVKVAVSDAELTQFRKGIV